MPTVELNQNLLVEIGGWPAMKEARGLVQRGRVTNARREGDIIRATVQGAEKTHEPQITLAERIANIDVRCTCAEFRKASRVCPHILAAGLALLEGSRRPPGDGQKVAGAGPRAGSPPPGGDLREAQSGQSRATRETVAPGDTTAPAQGLRRLPRFLLENAPPNTPQIEITALLPLQLKEAFAKDPVRIILEARRENETHTQPFDTILAATKSAIAVSEDDDRLLTALESTTGSASGINAVPRAKIGAFLHAIGNHPRIWIGKKQRIDVQSCAERAQIILSRREDGALQLNPLEGPAPAGPGMTARSSLPQSNAVLPNWHFNETTLTETPALPPGFTSGTRLIPQPQIPDFLSRELPALERTCEITFAPGLEEFRLEIGRPEFEAKLEGALSGLTLDLIAHYDGKNFPLNGKTESTAYQRYVPDAHQPNRFWRRNVLAERAALTEIEASGFSLMRSGAATFSLISENNVARFLANVLPRWKRNWKVTFGPRLESTLEQVDIAQPEFSMRSGSGEDWLSLDLKLSVGGQPIAIDQTEIQRWLQTGQSHARTASKRVLLVPTEAWSEMKEVLADCEVEQEPGKISLKKTYAPFLSGALTAQGFREAGHGLTTAATIDVKAALDSKLWKQLRPYQARGVEWLANLAQQNFQGLLADDMGLGKTLQALTFAAWLQKVAGARRRAGSLPSGGDLREAQSEKTRAARETVASADATVPAQGPAPATSRNQSATLVVCPTSLVTNWLREAERFTPHLRTLDLTGTDRAEKWAARGDHDLLVTSYAILRRDIELYRAESFALVILDEAQHIKNRASQNAQSAKALRSQHRLILTGTPLENSVLDLWSLYDFLLPGYLGTAAEFKQRYETPLTKSPEPKLMERLRHKVKPFFLRRTKEEVLTELPPKLEFPTLIELSDEQREVYRAVLAQGRREVFEHSDKAGKKSGLDRLAVLTTLLRLRQVCCHLDLLPSNQKVAGAGPRAGSPPDGGDLREAQSEKSRALREAVASTNATVPAQGLRRLPSEEGTAAQRAAATEEQRWSEPSAKMDRTFELIDEAIDGGHRVLLFSQFVKVLHLLREEALRREMRFCYLDGQTTERQAEVDKFQADAGIPLFFISLKAGGTGLNLTGADTVIHFDPWWNPAVEEQATSRAHRMGQARSVSAYKLIAAGTVEEKIQRLQARKRELFEASLGGDAAFVEKLTGDDLEELLAE